MSHCAVPVNRNLSPTHRSNSHPFPDHAKSSLAQSSYLNHRPRFFLLPLNERQLSWRAVLSLSYRAGSQLHPIINNNYNNYNVLKDNLF